jgi:hypothetical protein
MGRNLFLEIERYDRECEESANGPVDNQELEQRMDRDKLAIRALLLFAVIFAKIS